VSGRFSRRLDRSAALKSCLTDEGFPKWDSEARGVDIAFFLECDRPRSLVVLHIIELEVAVTQTRDVARR
jgi:hypothetical protein